MCHHRHRIEGHFHGWLPSRTAVVVVTPDSESRPRVFAAQSKRLFSMDAERLVDICVI